MVKYIVKPREWNNSNGITYNSYAVINAKNGKIMFTKGKTRGDFYSERENVNKELYKRNLVKSGGEYDNRDDIHYESTRTGLNKDMFITDDYENYDDMKLKNNSNRKSSKFLASYATTRVSAHRRKGTNGVRSHTRHIHGKDLV